MSPEEIALLLSLLASIEEQTVEVVASLARVEAALTIVERQLTDVGGLIGLVLAVALGILVGILVRRDRRHG